MKQRGLLICLIVLMLTTGVFAQDSTVGEDGVGDSLFPRLGNGGYDAQHYTIALETPVTENAITATMTLEAIATQDLTSFNLDFVGLNVDRVLVNGEEAAFERQGQELIITPATPLAKDDLFTVEIAYHGTPRAVISPMLGPMGWNYSRGSVYVAGEPEGAATWYPVNDHPLDKATYRFEITVPQGIEVAANGLLVETIENGDKVTYVFEVNQPMASYLATVNIDDFVIQESESASGIPIRNYIPEELLEYAHVFDRQGEMIEYFSTLFGEYPFDVYGAVVIDQFLGYALETQTMSLFGSDMLLGDPEQAERVVAHELSHQWFGDSVSLVDWSDIWLNEGFASYAEWLWAEYNGGEEALNEAVISNYQFMSGEAFLDYGYTEQEAIAQARQFGAPGEPTANELFNASVYLRGGLVLHALRLAVGDDEFFEILRTYAERFQYGNARTADFIALAEEISGRDLDKFFNEWLYEVDLPPIPELGLAPLGG